ncbi:MAG TPA: rod shape-determining protein MreC [bacterium]|nr:rod shape-determining protein MreC [bacterium]
MFRPNLNAWQDRAALLVVLVGLGLLIVPHRLRIAVTQPFQVAVLAPLRLGTAVSQSLRDTRAENERLSRLAAQLAMENARLESASQAAGATPPVNAALIRARVIGRDLITFEHWLTISRGTLNGVRPGAPVITPDGICGMVVACGKHQSLVQTLLAPDSRVAVLNRRSRVPALARPDRAGGLVLDYAPKQSDFRPGDTLVTAGLGTVFPKGLMLGEVIAVPDRPEALFKPVTVRPFVDISRIEQVFVISLPAGALPDTGTGWLENTSRPEVSIPDQSGE